MEHVGLAAQFHLDLFGFDRHAKFYADAARNLGLLEEPDLSHAGDGQAKEAVTSYVEQVEQVFRDEQAQWGQLANETPGARTKLD